MHLEYTFLELGRDLFFIGIFGEGERAQKCSKGSLNPMELLFLFFLLALALTGNGKDAIFNRHFHLLLFHLRQVCLDQVFLIVFGDVHPRRPIRQRDIAVAKQPPGKPPELRKPSEESCPTDSELRRVHETDSIFLMISYFISSFLG